VCALAGADGAGLGSGRTISAIASGVTLAARAASAIAGLARSAAAVARSCAASACACPAPGAPPGGAPAAAGPGAPGAPRGCGGAGGGMTSTSASAAAGAGWLVAAGSAPCRRKGMIRWASACASQAAGHCHMVMGRGTHSAARKSLIVRLPAAVVPLVGRAPLQRMHASKALSRAATAGEHAAPPTMKESPGARRGVHAEPPAPVPEVGSRASGAAARGAAAPPCPSASAASASRSFAWMTGFSASGDLRAAVAAGRAPAAARPPGTSLGPRTACTCRTWEGRCGRAAGGACASGALPAAHDVAGWPCRNRRLPASPEACLHTRRCCEQTAKHVNCAMW